MDSPIRHKKKDFILSVYDVVAQIPCGRVTTYGAIASTLGTKQGARMVGWALHEGHRNDIDLPYHRVVNRHGLLTGKHHFVSPNAMQRELEAEGTLVQDDKVLSFERLFWDPATT